MKFNIEEREIVVSWERQQINGSNRTYLIPIHEKGIVITLIPDPADEEEKAQVNAILQAWKNGTFSPAGIIPPRQPNKDAGQNQLELIKAVVLDELREHPWLKPATLIRKLEKRFMEADIKVAICELTSESKLRITHLRNLKLR